MRPLAALVPLLLAACNAQAVETAAGEAGRQCFWASQVTGFSDAGPDRAIVNIGVRESWEMELSPGCPDVNWALDLGIRSRGSERICSGRDAELLVPEASQRGARRCIVRNIRLLTPDEARAVRAVPGS